MTEKLNPLTPEQALAELLKLDLDSRRDLVADDVGQPNPKYRCIPAHDLAEALGVPDAYKPGPEWSFTRYAELTDDEEQLEEDGLDCMNCVAHYTVTTPSGDDLCFEGEIEDDGECLTLLTPYDEHDNLFVDISDCITEEW